MSAAGAREPLSYTVRRSPYFERTLEAGAIGFMVYNHTYMPLDYGRDPMVDYRAITEGVTLWDVGAERQAQLRGPDALSFADYLSPRDLLDLAVGRCRFTPVCESRAARSAWPTASCCGRSRTRSGTRTRIATSRCGPTALRSRVARRSRSRKPTWRPSSFTHTLGYNAGVQRELTKDMSIELDYFHRDIRNLLGLRNANIAFESRVLGRRFLPPFTQGPIQTFGPFYEGQYDALVINFNKRYSQRFLIGASYTYAQGTDNSLGINSAPSDSFVGTVPVVVETSTGRSNATGEFTRANGTLVQAAGTFLNGPDRDKGPSDLAIDHVLQANGMVELRYQIQISGIFRAQSGFHFSRAPASGVLVDPDGDASVNAIDVNAGRNAFTTPPFVNLDMRFAKRFKITSGVKAQLLIEFFNLFNRQNPAAVGRRQDVPLEPFGLATQVLPGREGQIGFRIEF